MDLRPPVIGERMSDRTIAVVTGVLCITILGVTYFVTVRQDGTVLLSLSSVIGGLIGYLFGKKRRYE